MSRCEGQFKGIEKELEERGQRVKLKYVASHSLLSCDFALITWSFALLSKKGCEEKGQHMKLQSRISCSNHGVNNGIYLPRFQKTLTAYASMDFSDHMYWGLDRLVPACFDTDIQHLFKPKQLQSIDNSFVFLPLPV